MFSFFETMVLDKRAIFQLDLIDVLFYHAAYSLTCFFLHSTALAAIHRVGSEPTEMRGHCRDPARSRSDQARTVQKGKWVIVVWVYYQLFPSSSFAYTTVLPQCKLPLADLCVFIPTPSFRSHLTDIS